MSPTSTNEDKKTASIEELLEQTDGRNIAEDLNEDHLKKLGQSVVTRFERDEGSMTDWSTMIDDGYELISQDYNPRSEPFEGASNYKSPILAEAAIRFGDRAVLEILNKPDLIKAEVIGRDKSGDKAKRVERVVEFMNYQLNHQMTEWRGQQEALLYLLPLVGNLFKKTFYDPFKGRNVSVLIHYPDFVVNQATTSIEECRSFTHILPFDRNAVYERQNSGLWLDEEEVNIYPEVQEDSTGDADKGSNEDSGATASEDNEDKFYEQHCFEDLDGDGYAEPYIITVHARSQQVVRIVARYHADGIKVKYNDRVESVSDALERQAKAFMESTGEGTETALSTGFEADFEGMEMYSIEPDSQITSYPFYPAVTGEFLGWGYFHLTSNLSMGLNLVTNLLLDAGVLSNLGGGFVAKNFRQKMGPVRLKPGMWLSTNISARDLNGALLPNPTQEPSATLMVLSERLDRELRNLTLVAGNEENGIMANTAPTTALAMISEQAIPTSALLLRVVEAASKEFKKLFDLNRRFADPEDYKIIIDDKDANFEADFNSKLMDIIPTANPEMSSKMQRIQLAEAQMVVLPQVMQTGGNAIAIVENYFEMIGSEIIDRVFPEEGAMTQQERDQLKKMQEATEQANELAKVQISLLKQQVENEGIEAKSLAQKRTVEMREIRARIGKILAESMLISEKAESEELKNRISTYTASMKAIIDGLDIVQRGYGNESTQSETRSALEELSS